MSDTKGWEMRIAMLEEQLVTVLSHASKADTALRTTIENVKRLDARDKTRQAEFEKLKRELKARADVAEEHKQHIVALENQMAMGLGPKKR